MEHNEEDPEDKKEEEDIDMKKLQSNYEETNQIMDILEDFEEDYGSSKKNLNSLDKSQLNTDVNAKTLRQCYRIIKNHLHEENPTFDQVKMDQTLMTLTNDVSLANKNLSRAKGEYISVNDTIVNKDTNAFKLSTIKKARAKQIVIIKAFEEVNIEIFKNEASCNEIYDKYVDFEKNLFVEKTAEIETVVNNCNELVTQINEQIA